MESLIGAIFLDSHCDLKIVWHFIEKLFGHQLEKIMKVKHKNFTAELMKLFPEKVIFKNPEVMKDGKVSRKFQKLCQTLNQCSLKELVRTNYLQNLQPPNVPSVK